MKRTLKIKRLRAEAVLPLQATEGSAGMDLCACLNEPVTIRPGELKMIPTGLAVEPEGEDCALFLFARSGLGVKHGICLSNGVGVVDRDYRGEVCVGLCNVSDMPYTIQPGERVAQMILMPVFSAQIVQAETLSETRRGAGGFGSSGKL